MITCDTGHPGNVLSLGGAVPALLPAPAGGWPRGAQVNLAHFEEGHHERLLVIRAISPYQPCFSRVYTETFKPNRKRRKVKRNSAVALLLSATSVSAPLAHSLLLTPNIPFLPPWPMDIFMTALHPCWTSLHCSIWFLGSPLASLVPFWQWSYIDRYVKHWTWCVMTSVLLPVKHKKQTWD